MVPRRPPEDLLGRDPSLKRSVSADVALSEKSPYLGGARVRLGLTTRPYQRQRDRAEASLGGDHHHHSRIARKLLLARASSASGGPIPQSPQTRTPAAAGPGWSEPWRRSPSPLAHSAKAPPRQSLISERRPDPAEPTTHTHQRKRDRAGASLGGDHHHPSRTARKLLLARVSSASGGPIPRSAPHALTHANESLTGS